MRGASAPTGTRFVGRDAELRILRAELDAALAGEGRIAYLLGEPGIGKTRTTAALAGLAAERRAPVAWGRCHEVEGAPAYWPWVQALSGACDALPEPGRELAALLPLLRTDATALAGDASPEQARFELFRRVASALAHATREQPLVIALDDLHWADAGSLRLLEFLGREVAAMPLLVIATLREGESRGAGETAPLLSSLLRLGRSIRLSGLARDAVAALLSDRLDDAPPGAVVEQVLGVTDGNPYLVIELAHLLAAGASPFDNRQRTPVPPGARELLRQRLAPLAGASRRALQAAAVIGREFELTSLARMLGATEPEMIQTLEAPLALGLVREVPGSLRRLTFAHALLRETLYEGLAAGERASLHAAFADVLEALGAIATSGSRHSRTTASRLRRREIRPGRSATAAPPVSAPSRCSPSRRRSRTSSARARRWRRRRRPTPGAGACWLGSDTRSTPPGSTRGPRTCSSRR